MRRIIFLYFWNRCFPVCENVSSAGTNDASGNLKVYLYFRQIYFLTNWSLVTRGQWSCNAPMFPLAACVKTC